MVTFLRVNMEVEFDNTGLPTGNWVSSGAKGTGMTSSGPGQITANKIVTGGETDSHLWVNVEAFIDREVTPLPQFLASGTTFTCYFLTLSSANVNAPRRGALSNIT